MVETRVVPSASYDALRIVVSIESAGTQHAPAHEATFGKTFIRHQARCPGSRTVVQFRGDDRNAASTGNHSFQFTTNNSTAPFLAIKEFFAGKSEFNLVHARLLDVPASTDQFCACALSDADRSIR